MVDGRVLDGRLRIAGEWGHNPIPWPKDGERPGPACYCGRTGCIENFSRDRVCRRLSAALAGRSADATEIVLAAGSGDANATLALDIYEDRLARVLASIINVLDPDVIVLGGGLSNITRLYDRVPERWQPFVFSDTADTPLVPARHGDSSESVARPGCGTNDRRGERMRFRFSSAALLTLALSWTVLAQTQSPMRPGNWEAMMKMSMPGMEMPPMKQTHASRDGERSEASIPKGPGGGDCKMSDYKLSASSAMYKMTCTKPTEMTMVGEMKYIGTDAYTGVVNMESGGQKMSMSFDAKRIGECPAEK